MLVGLSYTLKHEMEEELVSRGIKVTDEDLEEYDSIDTIRRLKGAIKHAGHEVIELGWGSSLLDQVMAATPDLVFNIAEGYGGRSREAQVPAALEMLGIPYVGSDPMALAVSLDKQASKDLVRANGVIVPKGLLIREREMNSTTALIRNKGLAFPLIVKPAYEGSSKGIRMDSVVDDDIRLTAKVAEVIARFKQPALVEEYIWGREITVGIVGDPPRVLATMEVVPKDKSKPAWTVYSLEVKRSWKEVADYIVNPPMDPQIRIQLEQAALTAFEALGCKDMARIDFRLRGTTQQPVFLEINTLPGLSETDGDLPMLAAGVGLSYDGLIGQILDGAISRLPK